MAKITRIVFGRVVPDREVKFSTVRVEAEAVLSEDDDADMAFEDLQRFVKGCIREQGGKV